MTGVNRSDEIGLGQAYRLCNMPADKRLKFISDGLPIILESARSLLAASRALKNFPREADILERQAEEECAKILILIDIARCPPKVISSRMGAMIKWFYDHLARLIYVKAQSWKAGGIKQLQEYIDGSRKTHYLEGEYGEYIMPNWELFSRELALYADVMCDENSEPSWCSPLRDETPDILNSFDPICFSLAEGLEASGAFTDAGLRIMRDIWGKVDFSADLEWPPSRELFWEMADKLTAAGLVDKARLNENHIRNLRDNWQMPMYRIDFAPIPISLERLRAERDSQTPYF